MTHGDIEPVNEKVAEVPYEQPGAGHPKDKKGAEHWSTDVQVVAADEFGEPDAAVDG